MRVRATVVALALVGVAAVAPGARSAAADGPSPTVLMVGDSTMRGMSEDARTIIATDYELTFDYGGCRRLIEPSCRAVPNALDVIRSTPGQEVVVVMTGYNDWLIGDAIDVLVGEAMALGTSHVIWLTYRTDIVEGAQKPIAIAEVFADHNRELAEHAPKHPSLTVLDWDGYSAGHDDWFLWDGFHLSEAGGFALAAYLTQTMDGFGISRCASVVATGTPVGGPTAQPAAAAPPGRLSLDSRRLLDTRPGDADAVSAPLGAGRVVSIPVSGTAPNGTASVLVNVAAVDPCRDGFVTVFPCGEVPLASNVNYARRRTAANLAAVALSPAGEVCVYSSAQTDLVVDLVATVGVDGLGYRAAPPARLVDTRADGGALSPTSPLVVPIATATDVPPDVHAIAVSVTAVDPRADGYLVAYPCGTAPDVSSVNFTAGRDVANLAIVGVDTDQAVCVRASAPTDVVVDVMGWLAASGDRFQAMVPVRRVDTRLTAPGSPAAGQIVAVTIDHPALLNVTAVGPSAPGFLSVYPCGPLPLVSALNYRAGDAVANLVPAAPNASGAVCVYLQQPGHVVIDQLGEFVP